MATFEKTIQSILAGLTFDDAKLEVKVTDTEVNVTITVKEEDTGVLIGYHGEKIDALQLIFNLIYNQNKDNFVPVRLDINQYRAHRTETLHELADKAAQQALESGREIILPPLSPSERRQVHVHLSKRPDISTYSEGEGRGRRLIISPQASKQ